MHLPKPMVGFNLSNGLRSVNNRLPHGPAIGLLLEFVDSKYSCAAARKRGYIHNLPLVNVSPILSIPPKTIFHPFPLTKKWWPSWDPRRQFNCLQTCVASAKLLERIRLALTNCEDPPPVRVQNKVCALHKLGIRMNYD